jgi:hypothetical protein
VRLNTDLWLLSLSGANFRMKRYGDRSGSPVMDDSVLQRFTLVYLTWQVRNDKITAILELLISPGLLLRLSRDVGQHVVKRRKVNGLSAYRLEGAGLMMFR